MVDAFSTSNQPLPTSTADSNATPPEQELHGTPTVVTLSQNNSQLPNLRTAQSISGEAAQPFLTDSVQTATTHLPTYVSRQLPQPKVVASLRPFADNHIPPVADSVPMVAQNTSASIHLKPPIIPASVPSAILRAVPPAQALKSTAPAALAASQSRYETIQIAPHPTTNRFPWAPIANPTIEIAALPPPPIMTVPVAAPPVSVPPVAQVKTVQVAPVPAKVVAPKPALPPPPRPVAPPPIPAVTAVPKAQQLPSTPPPASLQAAQPPVLPQLIPQTALKLRSATTKQPVHSGTNVVNIYSDYTREVWRVFHPSRVIRILQFGLLALILGSIIGFWLASGAPTNLMNLPLLRSILHTE